MSPTRLSVLVVSLVLLVPLADASAGAVPEELLQRIRADAAERAGITRDAVSVVSAQAVTWSDSALGCAKPGIAARQVLTPGYRVIVRTGAQTLDYHAGRNGRFVMCPADLARPPSSGASDVRAEVREYESAAPAGPATIRHDVVPDSLLRQVLDDAAARTGTDASKLEVISTEQVTWNDGALGCAQPGHMYTQALVPGYRIWVRHAVALFDYHASRSGAFVVCPAATKTDDDSIAQ
jgi:hypothetical protein